MDEVFLVSQSMLQGLSGGSPKPECGLIINSGRRQAEIIGPLTPDEGMAAFAGFVFPMIAVVLWQSAAPRAFLPVGSVPRRREGEAVS